MSPTTADEKRRDALAHLKARKNVNGGPGRPPDTPIAPSQTTSPESHVLVPSSSPAATPRQSVSKFFNSANGSSHATGSGSRGSTLDGDGSSRDRPVLNGNTIPSSRLGFAANGNGVHGSTGPSGMGSPQSIVHAIAKRQSGDIGLGDTTNGSFSYEPKTTDVSSTSRPDLSPNTPEPLSRLKRKYDESPSGPSRPSVPVSPPPRSINRTPSLVLAARNATKDQEDQMISRIANQFSNVNKEYIRSSVKRHPGDFDAVVNEIQGYSERLGSNASRPSSPIRIPSSPAIHRPPPRPVGSSSSLGSTLVSRPIPLPSSSSSSIASSSRPPVPATLVGRPSASSTLGSKPVVGVMRRPAVPPTPAEPVSPVAPSPVKIVKPKKNEKSRIYANRDGAVNGSKSKRKDPDESESAEDDANGVSDIESEMSWSGDEGRRKKRRKAADEEEVDAQGAAFKAFNEVEVDMLTGTIACSAEQAQKIISLRPFENVDDIYTKLQKARGISPKLFEQYVEIMEGYVQIDACLNKCEGIAAEVARTLAVWRGASMLNDSVVGTPRSDGLNDVKVDVAKVSELLRNETDMRKKKVLGQYIQAQPSSMGEGTVLKDYQLLGLNWLNLLYTKKIGCILADEMGLGKTIQVIAFLAHLKEKRVKGPHMIFVPASTLENWIREFERFGPEIDVQTYYGSQAERADLRDHLKRRFRKGALEVVLTSYTQVTAPDDLNFFRKKIQFETCTYDEGHRLKSCTTKAYSDLMSIKPRWRLLLTGTPLQNNLQELVSLLMFIHKDTFNDAEPYLRAIFKSQGHANLLSQQRVSRARTMLTPFVLRRRKAHVLDLPPKIETIEHCEMTPIQAKLYRETLQRSKKVLEEMDDDTLEAAAEEDEEKAEGKPPTGKPKIKKEEPKKGPFVSSGSHILMDLRKAASHPLLFRRLYTDAKVKQLAKACLATPKWCDSNYDYVVEDLEVMSDAEISHFCEEAEFDSIKKLALASEAFLEGGKVTALKRQLDRCKTEGKRMLLFSQFVMILDILEVVLDHFDVKFTRLDGSTRTDERQTLVDEFNDDAEITVFLLSTKAGGVGINLTAASVVVIYDQDFNPHNDRQAADRAYRIGQDKDVEVIKLITKGSIDEDMLAIGETKLQLDDAVGGDEITLDGEIAGPAQKDDKMAKEMKKSLLTTLRNRFDGHGVTANGHSNNKTNGDGTAAKDEPVKAERAPTKMDL